jgi:hypothetical protein
LLVKGYCIDRKARECEGIEKGRLSSTHLKDRITFWLNHPSRRNFFRITEVGLFCMPPSRHALTLME